MNIIRSGLAVLLLSVTLLQFGCARKETHEGTAGNYYSVSVQAPFGVENPSFDWYIRTVPPKSQLSFSDMMVTEDGKKMTFQPDEAGKYVFELIVSKGEAGEAASQTYEFMVQAPLPSPPMEASIETEPDTSSAEIVEMADAAAPEEPVPQETSAVAAVEEPPEERMPPKVSKPEKPARGRKIPAVEGKLTIQVSSWDDLEKARPQVEELVAMGFDAYVQKAYFEETGEVWYRVRIGTFTDYETARRAASEISSVIKINTWVDRVRVDVEKDQGG